MNHAIRTEVALSIIAIIAIVIGGSVWLAGKDDPVSKKEGAAAIVDNGQKKDAVADDALKKYQNIQYGFEFSHPSYLNPDSVSDIRLSFESLAGAEERVIGIEVKLKNSKPGLPDVDLLFRNNPPSDYYPDFSDVCEPYEKNSCLITFGETSDGIKTMSRIHREGPTRESTWGYRDVSFSRGERLVTISRDLPSALSFGEEFPNKEEAGDDIDKIASSFHFFQDDVEYRNEKYGFELTFPESWRRYEVEEGDAHVVFNSPWLQDVFAILVFTTSEWNKGQGDYIGHVLGQNSDYVYFFQAQPGWMSLDPSERLSHAGLISMSADSIAADVENIEKTFRLIRQP